MTQQEKRRFINELMTTLKRDILAKVPDMPEQWDGHELRRYIADRAIDCCFIPMQGKRAKEYKQAVITRNL